MRIIAGTARGRKLHTLKGELTRPTADRVKEAIFSMLSPYIHDAVVLDAFAGSGALGLEALSRGALAAHFCEENAAAAKVIKKNITDSGLGQALLYTGNLFSILPRFASDGTIFDLVFLDPPYASSSLERAVSAIYEHKLLQKDGIIIAESAAEQLPLSFAYCSLLKEKKYGSTAVRFYQFCE